MFIVRLLPPECPLIVAGLPPSPALSLQRLGQAQIHDFREELAVGLMHARLSAVPLLRISRQTQVSTHWSPGMKRVPAFTSLPAPGPVPQGGHLLFQATQLHCLPLIMAPVHSGGSSSPLLTPCALGGTKGWQLTSHPGTGPPRGQTQNPDKPGTVRRLSSRTLLRAIW